MTSQINPADIDGNYPVAGVSNNTQGMRDNFTNTKTNFQYAADEITELQNKSVFKAALNGTTLDNNLANNVIYNAQIKGFSGTVVAIANTSGAITVDCSAGHYQSINMAGNINLSFISNTWPTAGTVGMVRTQITVDQIGRTVTLPSAVSNGTTGIQGYSSNVITFANTGTYEFGFVTSDAGNAITIFDLNRPLSYYTNDVNVASTTVSTTTTTGALVVAGGVGINGNLHAGQVSVNTVTGNVLSAIGNVIGGNINTAGTVSAASVSASGNITGGNINTGAQVIATGNITGGNINTGAQVIATGNVSGGNLKTGGLISATGSITSGSLITAVGNITGGNVLSSAVISAVGNAVVLSGTAIPAGGTAGAGYKFSSTANFGVFFGSGVPTLSAAKGSLYLRSDGSTTNDRMYVNTNGSTTWTAVITVA